MCHRPFAIIGLLATLLLAAASVAVHESAGSLAAAQSDAAMEHTPEHYLPAYGGFCALGMANGYKDGMHPEAFAIVGGRLFFNLTPAIHRHWESRRQTLIERGDENWPRVRDAAIYGPGVGPL